MTRLPPIPVIAILVYGGVYCLWLTGHTATYSAILTAWGIEPFRFPFLDIDAVRTARECAARGLDVFVTNPCDVLGRVHIYSPLWLAGASSPGPVIALKPVGIAVDLAFLLSLALLPRPRQWQGSVAILAATLSTMVVYAVERANNDLVIFVILVISARVLSTRSVWWPLAYAGYLVAGLLKFYPLILAAGALRERTGRAAIILALYAITILAFVWRYHASLKLLFSHFPEGSPFADLFGASNLGRGIGIVLSAGDGGNTGPQQLLPTAATIVMGLVALVVALRSYAVLPRPPDAIPLPEPAREFMTTGILVLVGCFFAGQNVGYRGIYFLMILPGLASLAESGAAVASRRRLWWLIGLIIALMWEEPVRHLLFHLALAHAAGGDTLIFGFWILREVLWWVMIGVLAGILCRVATSQPRHRRTARSALGQASP